MYSGPTRAGFSEFGPYFPPERKLNLTARTGDLQTEPTAREGRNPSGDFYRKPDNLRFSCPLMSPDDARNK
jgi:hypothetical protein